MAKGKSEIMEDIEGHITKCAGDMAEWYVGVAAKPKERLFDNHSVAKDRRVDQPSCIE